ncbi:DMT family transporter [Qipengyuania sp. ASV99]|uniref:DMT family transporter n=1 Tax=Qipengyuania sp. ASV99 TaxID=3399681 RepID=UPI003A4C6191
MNASTLAILLACNIVWALNVVVSKLAVDDFGVPPLFYTVLRSVLVVAVLFPLLRPLPAQLGRVLLIGFAISGGSFALLFIGLQTASPSAAGIVNLSGAPLTVLFAILFLKEEVRWRRGIGMALTLGGVVMAIGSPAGSQSGIGLAFVFASALLGALGSVFVKRLEIGSAALQAWAALISIAAILPMTLAFESGQMAAVTAAPWEVAGCVVFAGLIVSVGAHSAYFKLLKLHDANLIVPLTLLTPLLTIGFGAWLTGDPIGWRLLAGAGVAMSGVAIIVLRPSRKLFKPLLVRPRI